MSQVNNKLAELILNLKNIFHGEFSSFLRKSPDISVLLNANMQQISTNVLRES